MSERLSSVADNNDLEVFETFSEKFKRRTSRLNSYAPSDHRNSISKQVRQVKGLTKSMARMKMFTRFRQNSNSSQSSENSYAVKIEDSTCSNKIKEVIENVLEVTLKDKKYDSKTCGVLACSLSTIIKERLKNLHLNRYKFICQVVIGQTEKQDVCVGSRCLWMTETDTHQQANYSNGSLFAVVTVFAVYFE